MTDATETLSSQLVRVGYLKVNEDHRNLNGSFDGSEAEAKLFDMVMCGANLGKLAAFFCIRIVDAKQHIGNIAGHRVEERPTYCSLSDFGTPGFILSPQFF